MTDTGFLVAFFIVIFLVIIFALVAVIGAVTSAVAGINDDEMRLRKRAFEAKIKEIKRHLRTSNYINRIIGCLFYC